jgi:RimJ/RimL family protein N-acetyltransferase
MIAPIGRFTVSDVSIWDVADVFALYSDARIVRYLGVPQLHSVEEANTLVQRYSRSTTTKWLTVRDTASREFLGIVGLEVSGHQATVFITFKRSRSAMGAGRQFSVPFVQWIFTHPQIYRVWSFCHVDNVPAQRVTERMGAEREGRARRFAIFPNLSSEPQDCYVYSITR